MAVLDFDPEEFRRVGELVDAAGSTLNTDLGDDVPAVGGDEVSQAIMDNLNARRRWLAEHLQSGFSQAMAAADGITDTANAFTSEDSAAASRYSTAGYGGDTTPASSASAPTGTSAPTSAPSTTTIPDISGRDGETLAQSLEAGAGPIPATEMAVTLAGLSARAQQSVTTLTAAQTQLESSGQSQAHAPLMTKLTRALTWTQGVAGHADALATGYTSAVSFQSTTLAAVGPSAGWRALKTAYGEAVTENALTGGLAQDRVDALWTALDNQQKQATTAVSGYQTAGEAVSVPPGTLPDPGLNPNGESAPTDDKKGAAEEPEDSKDSKKKKSGLDDSASGSGMQDMLSPMMGAMQPLMQSMGKANPLEPISKAAQQFGQQVSKLAGGGNKPLASPLKAASLAKPRTGTGKGAGGGGKGAGGGGGLKGASLPAASMHPAAASATPTSTNGTLPPAKPAATLAGGSGAGGMGMMPMGARPGGGEKSSTVRRNYGGPLADVEEQGRPGTVPNSEPAQPQTSTVEPTEKDRVRQRLARRHKESGIE